MQMKVTAPMPSQVLGKPIKFHSWMQARIRGLRDAQNRLEEDASAIHEQQERLAGLERGIRRTRQELEDDRSALVKREQRADAQNAEITKASVSLQSMRIAEGLSLARFSRP